VGDRAGNALQGFHAEKVGVVLSSCWGKPKQSTQMLPGVIGRNDPFSGTISNARMTTGTALGNLA
jgi:hypothetical protein